MLEIFVKRFGNVLYFGLNSSVSLFILILVSVFTTWLVRGWLVVATVDHKFSTNFIFRPCHQQGVCSYPYASINLRRPYSPLDSILTPGLPYLVALRFRVSDSETNQFAGMFMVKFNFENGRQTVLSSCATSTSIPYRSWLVRTLRRLFFWPLLIFDYLQEYHSIYVECPDALVFFDDASETTTALEMKIEIQNVGVEFLNDGSVELRGHLRGLQYYLYWWPILSTCALFFMIFWCSTSAACGLWLIKSSRKSEEKKMSTPPSHGSTNGNGSSQFSFLNNRTSSTKESSSAKKDDFFEKDKSGDRKISPIRRRYDEDNDDVHCFQRRMSSRMQQALLDLDDSNLGS